MSSGRRPGSPADAASPSDEAQRAPPMTSTTTVALGGDRLRATAVEVALEMERRIRDVTRTGAVGVGVVVTLATVAVAANVGGPGLYLFIVLLIGAALGISASVATLALSTVLVEGFSRVHWRRLANSYGLDAATAAIALEDARTQLYEQERARLEALQARQKPRALDRGPRDPER